MKYTQEPFVFSKAFSLELPKKEAVLKKDKNEATHILGSDLSGVKKTMYLDDMVSKVVTIEDLFSRFL